VAATSDSDGIGFDIVPCFLLKPTDGSDWFYLVPNGIGGWMHSNPRNDTRICSDLQDYHHGTYRQAVRLLKYWNKYEFANRFQSYYIELAAAKKFTELRNAGIPIQSASQAFAIAFAAVAQAQAAGAAKPLLNGAPEVVAPILDASQRGILVGDAARTNQAVEQAWNYSDLTSALTTLNVVFLSAKFF
jgi:hypothetical protein